jgi:hypothetical protein
LVQSHLGGKARTSAVCLPAAGSSIVEFTKDDIRGLRGPCRPDRPASWRDVPIEIRVLIHTGAEITVRSPKRCRAERIAVGALFVRNFAFVEDVTGESASNTTLGSDVSTFSVGANDGTVEVCGRESPAYRSAIYLLWWMCIYRMDCTK